MPAFLAPAIISGIGALGNWLANRKKSNTSQQTQTGTQIGSVTSTGTTNQFTRPDLSSETQQYLDLIRGRYTDLLNQDADLSGFAATGVQNINRGADIRSRAVNNILAARGLSYSPMAAGANQGLESSRVSDVVNFQNQIPLLRDQLMRERLNEAAGFFSRIPTGQTSGGTTTGTETRDLTSSSSGTGSTTDPGNQLGGLFGGLGSTLAYLYGTGAFQKPKQTTNTGAGLAL